MEIYIIKEKKISLTCLLSDSLIESNLLGARSASLPHGCNPSAQSIASPTNACQGMNEHVNQHLSPYISSLCLLCDYFLPFTLVFLLCLSIYFADSLCLENLHWLSRSPFSSYQFRICVP